MLLGQAAGHGRARHDGRAGQGRAGQDTTAGHGRAPQRLERTRPRQSISKFEFHGELRGGVGSGYSCEMPWGCLALGDVDTHPQPLGPTMAVLAPRGMLRLAWRRMGAPGMYLRVSRDGGGGARKGHVAKLD